MKLILFRHGHAEELSEKVKIDSLRGLTAKGRKKTQDMGQILKNMDLVPKLIATSPLKRSLQTAEVLANLFGISEVHECVELKPNATVISTFSWLKSQHLSQNIVLLVGHEPQLSSFVSWILTGHHQVIVEMKKAGFAVLDLDVYAQPMKARLEVLVGPKVVG